MIQGADRKSTQERIAEPTRQNTGHQASDNLTQGEQMLVDATTQSCPAHPVERETPPRQGPREEGDSRASFLSVPLKRISNGPGCLGERRLPRLWPPGGRPARPPRRAAKMVSLKAEEGYPFSPVRRWRCSVEDSSASLSVYGERAILGTNSGRARTKASAYAVPAIQPAVPPAISIRLRANGSV